ncbi:MAG: hypothetical protein QW567_04725, partial [Candidatus Hadarchaeales archaeon]
MKGKAAAFGICLVLMLTAGAGGVSAEVLKLEEVKSFEVPPLTLGLAWDGKYLWVAGGNDENARVYKMSPDGDVLFQFYPPGPWPSDLTWDGENLWLVEEYHNKIFKLDTSGKVLFSFSSTYWPYGLAWDGENLWASDFLSGDVIKEPFVDTPEGKKPLISLEILPPGYQRISFLTSPGAM